LDEYKVNELNNRLKAAYDFGPDFPHRSLMARISTNLDRDLEPAGNRLQFAGLATLVLTLLVAGGLIWIAELHPRTPTTPAVTSPSTGPLARRGAAAAFDPGTGNFVLFGGSRGTSGELMDDTWVHDARAWIRIATSIHPSARFSAAAATDEGHRNLVLFGGYGGSPSAPDNANRPLGDTWIWTGESWMQAHPTTSPGARFGHSMAYDKVRGRVVLYGGQNGPNSVLNDAWAWDGNNWEKLSLVGGPRFGKVGAAMAFDPTTGELILTGVSPDSDLSTWTLQGSEWIRHAAAVEDQPWAHESQAAYLPASRRIFMLVYGPKPPDPPSQLLVWDGNTWSAVRSVVVPPARDGAAFAYCPALGQLILFGGSSVTQIPNGVNPGEVLSDTWAWDGLKWTRLG
jgi:hypothetical protein